MTAAQQTLLESLTECDLSPEEVGAVLCAYLRTEINSTQELCEFLRKIGLSRWSEKLDRWIG